MEIAFTTYRIQLKHTFGIARSAHNWYDIVYIFIQDGDIIGRGEAAPSLRYNESTERILSVLKQKVKLPEEDAIKVQEQLAFADDLTESLMVQLIH